MNVGGRTDEVLAKTELLYLKRDECFCVGKPDIF